MNGLQIVILILSLIAFIISFISLHKQFEVRIRIECLERYINTLSRSINGKCPTPPPLDENPSTDVKYY